MSRQPENPVTAGGGERIYAFLLRAYPRDFRRRFADSMSFAFAAEAARVRRRGRLALAWFWSRSAAHALLFGLFERIGRLQPSGTWRLGLRTDLVHAARRLRRSPAFTAAAVITLALGIGANTAIFSLVDGVLLQPLPYPHADRLVAVQHSAEGAGLPLIGVSRGTYVHYREYSNAFEDLTLFTPTSFALLGKDTALRVPGARVTQGFFEIFLDGPPPLGRAIDDADQEPGAPPVAMISDDLWRTRYDADRGIVGRSISIDGRPVEVIGVLPPAFDVPSETTQVWAAERLDPDEVILGGFGNQAVGRLAPGVTPEQARADLQRLIPTLADRFNPVAFDLIVTGGHLESIVRPLREFVVGNVAQMLWILLGTVAFVLAVACANVANLFLVRAEAQRRELAVRAALGAGRLQLLRHHLAESLVLSALGGVGGVALALIGVRWVVSWGPSTLPRLHDVGVNASVMLFAAAISLATGLVFGMIPTLSRRRPTAGAMIDGGRGATVGRARHRLRNGLVIAQVSLALVLLVGAGLMVRTFQQLRDVEPGFDAENALVLQIGLPRALYPDPAEAFRFHQSIIERLSTLPGVSAVGATVCLPLDPCDGRTPVYPEGMPFEPGETPPSVDVRGATEGYFRALGIPIVEGRGFEAADPQRAPVAVVSANLAARLWPGESAIGKRIFPDVPEEEPYTVVGVAGDHLAYGLAEPAPEFLYVSFLGPYSYVAPPQTLTYVVRSEVPPLSLAPTVRAAVRELDSNVPIANLRAMQEVLDRASAPTAFAMILLVIAGLVALTLGAVGVYGVLAYLVAQRRNEIGVRMALGARAADVGRMVLWQGMAVAGVGLALGLVGAVALSRVMTALLFGVDPLDPAVYAAGLLTLGVIALLATWLPARRA
ncbi:MAG: ABC transporter permease, partial [Acidobacteriota bacterium]